MRKHPNLFKSITPKRPEQAWVSDITYVSCKEGTVYLSLITDAFSRKILGYNVSRDLRTEGVLQALKMAIKSRRSALPLLHHSDRGLQYCSAPYHKCLPAMVLNVE
jgi:transposase InsO family protein